jgi:hypothetical protein
VPNNKDNSQEKALISDIKKIVWNSLNPITLKECVCVSNLFSFQYGDTYHEEFLNPSLLLGYLKRKSVLAFGFTNKEKEVIGFSILRSEPNAMLRLARVVVSTNYRGFGIGKKLCELASSLQHQYFPTSTILLADVVTHHPIMQRAVRSIGMMPIGFSIGRFNDYFGKGVRESTITYAKILIPSAKLLRQIFVPKTLYACTTKVLGFLHAERSIFFADSTVPFEEPSHDFKLKQYVQPSHRLPCLDLANANSMKHVDIFCWPEVDRVELLKIVDYYKKLKIENITVTIPSIDKISIVVLEELLSKGFVFSSIYLLSRYDRICLQWFKGNLKELKKSIICDDLESKVLLDEIY